MYYSTFRETTSLDLQSCTILSNYLIVFENLKILRMNNYLGLFEKKAYNFEIYGMELTNQIRCELSW